MAIDTDADDLKLVLESFRPHSTHREEELPEALLPLLGKLDFVKSGVRYRCECGKTHFDRSNEEGHVCPMSGEEINPDERWQEYYIPQSLFVDLSEALSEGDIKIRIQETEDEIVLGASSDLTIHLIPGRRVEGGCKVLPQNQHNILVDWEEFPRIYQHDREFLEELQQESLQAITRELDWETIDGNQFQQMVKELLQAEGYRRVKGGGSGPDGGKDTIYEGEQKSTAGEEKSVRVLVQAKYNQRYGKDDLTEYVTSAKDHNCSEILLATSEHQVLSGSISSRDIRGSYEGGGIDFINRWGRTKVERLLATHDDVREKFF